MSLFMIRDCGSVRPRFRALTSGRIIGVSLLEEVARPLGYLCEEPDSTEMVFSDGWTVPSEFVILCPTDASSTRGLTWSCFNASLVVRSKESQAALILGVSRLRLEFMYSGSALSLVTTLLSGCIVIISR